jgi:hypothetical protein
VELGYELKMEEMKAITTEMPTATGRVMKTRDAYSELDATKLSQHGDRRALTLEAF